MTEKEYADRCVRQHKAHTRVRSNGDKEVALGMGLFDLFSGAGWGNWSRFRVVRARSDGKKQLIQVAGIALSREYRTELLKEHDNGASKAAA
jgi:hypothetical protein